MTQENQNPTEPSKENLEVEPQVADGAEPELMVESSAQLIEELNQKLGEMQDNFLRAKAEG